MDHFFVARDGTPIHYFLLTPDRAPKGVVLMIHGGGEYAERYLPFAEFLKSKGYAAAGIDLRGYGQSGGPRGYAAHLEVFAEDIQALVRHLKKSFNCIEAGIPFVLFGHSLGGLISSFGAAFTFTNEVDGIVLSSPCFGLALRVSPLLHWAGLATSWVAPKKTFPVHSISEVLTHDPAMVQKHKNDPHICRVMSSRFYAEMHRGFRLRKKIAGHLKLPVHVFQAGDDRIVNAANSKKFFEELATRKKSYVEYPGLFHEIINETSRSSVYSDILRSIESISF